MRIVATTLDAAAAAALAPGAVPPPGGALLVVQPPARDRTTSARLRSRFEAVRSAAGLAPCPVALPGGAFGCLVPAPTPRSRASALAVAALALRSIEVERGLAPNAHPSDAAAMDLLRAHPSLADAWPWMAPCLDRGGFAPSRASPRSNLRLVTGRRAPEAYAARDWTPERLATLREMWDGGAIASEIAAALGDASKSAVIGKLTRLGLTGNGIVHRNPRRKGGRPTHRRPPAGAPPMDSGAIHV